MWKWKNFLVLILSFLKYVENLEIKSEWHLYNSFTQNLKSNFTKTFCPYLAFHKRDRLLFYIHHISHLLEIHNEILNQWFLKCDSWTGSISTVWECARISNSWVPPQIHWIKLSGEALQVFAVSKFTSVLGLCSSVLLTAPESRPHPRLTESESALQQDPPGNPSVPEILTCSV